MKIQKGSKVSVEYTGTFEDGTVFDTNKGKEPLEFEVGAKKVIPGFEEKIIGMEKGKTKKIKLAPEEAYGQPNEKLIIEIPKEVLNSKGVDPKPGMRVKMEPKDASHPPRVATIKEVNEKTIKIDMNHPLAGKTLIFDIKILDIV